MGRFRILKKILRIIALILPSFLAAFFFSDNSFATSYSDSFTSSNPYSTIYLCDNQLIDSGNSCSGLSYFYSTTSHVSLSTSYTSISSRLQVKVYVYNSSNSLTSDTYSCYFLSDSCYFHFNSVVQKLELSVYRWFDLLSNDSVVSFSFSDTSPFSNPSGSITLTSNGTYDVSNYAEAVVDVPPIPGDYHDDILAVRNSIIIIAAVLLFILFVFYLYRMFIVGGIFS